MWLPPPLAHVIHSSSGNKARLLDLLQQFLDGGCVWLIRADHALPFSFHGFPPSLPGLPCCSRLIDLASWSEFQPGPAAGTGNTNHPVVSCQEAVLKHVVCAGWRYDGLLCEADNTDTGAMWECPLLFELEKRPDSQPHLDERQVAAHSSAAQPPVHPSQQPASSPPDDLQVSQAAPASSHTLLASGPSGNQSHHCPQSKPAPEGNGRGCCLVRCCDSIGLTITYHLFPSQFHCLNLFRPAPTQRFHVMLAVKLRKACAVHGQMFCAQVHEKDDC